MIITILGKSVYDVCKKRDVFIFEACDSEHLGEKIVTTVVCCLFCVKFLVNLSDVTGIKERIFIEFNREYLSPYYSNSYNNFYFHSDSNDTDFSDNDQENEELTANQFRHLFCFPELRLYDFKYSCLCCNCRKFLRMVFEPKLHDVSS